MLREDDHSPTYEGGLHEESNCRVVRVAGWRQRISGQVTYQEFASYWPGVSSEDQPFAGHMNNTPKYVVSRTLEEPLEWSNSTLIKGSVAEAITRLKRQPGKDIGITGSVTLVQSLLREDMLDEHGLMVHPVVVGSGKRLFEEGGDP